jgi:hypothetical protein
MGFVKSGTIEFAVEHLADKPLVECYEFFAHIRKDIVKNAWIKANPKPKKTVKHID